MKIKIKNCLNPRSCMKCVNICPAKIFVLKPIGAPKIGKNVKKWEIKAIFTDFCNGCLSCVDICPERCIKVEF